MSRIEESLQGFVDALTDSGEWHDMTKAQQRSALQDAAVEFDKVHHGFDCMYQMAARYLNLS